MILHDISVDILSAVPYPGDRQTEFSFDSQIQKAGGFNVSSFAMSTHTGTHIDLPLHTLPNGRSVGEVPPSRFFGPCTVVTPKEEISYRFLQSILPQAEKMILFRSGNTAFLHDLRCAALLQEYHVGLIGTDAHSIAALADEYDVHNALLQRNILILENICLDAVKDGAYYLSAFPLLLGRAEAAPCRAVLIEYEGTSERMDE